MICLKMGKYIPYYAKEIYAGVKFYGSKEYRNVFAKTDLTFGKGKHETD